jgi:hypothetical protein
MRAAIAPGGTSRPGMPDAWEAGDRSRVYHDGDLDPALRGASAPTAGAA